MIPKTCKIYSNGVKTAIFLRKITNIAQNDSMALGGGCPVSSRRGGGVPPLTTVVPPHFGLPKLLFLDHHVTARQQQ